MNNKFRCIASLKIFIGIYFLENLNSYENAREQCTVFPVSRLSETHTRQMKKGVLYWTNIYRKPLLKWIDVKTMLKICDKLF